jgi:hypothetical protein
MFIKTTVLIFTDAGIFTMSPTGIGSWAGFTYGPGGPGPMASNLQGPPNFSKNCGALFNYFKKKKNIMKQLYHCPIVTKYAFVISRYYYY